MTKIIEIYGVEWKPDKNEEGNIDAYVGNQAVGYIFEDSNGARTVGKWMAHNKISFKTKMGFHKKEDAKKFVEYEWESFLSNIGTKIPETIVEQN